LLEAEESIELSEESEEELEESTTQDHLVLKDAVEEDALATEACKVRLERVTLAKPGMLILHKRETKNILHKNTLNSLVTIAETQLPRTLRLSGATLPIQESDGTTALQEEQEEELLGDQAEELSEEAQAEDQEEEL
jgi:hypothetical protein